MRIRATTLAVAPALVLLLACSGGGDKSAGGSTTAPAPTEATTTTEPSFSGTGSDRFCTEDRSAREALARLSTAQPTADALKQRYTATADSLRTLAGVAPDEIVGDVRLLAGAYDGLIAGMQRAGWDQSRLGAEINQNLGSQDVKVASERLQVYERKVCGIT